MFSTEEADPFANCHEVDEILFVTLELAGQEGLKALLDHLRSTDAIDRETLLGAADNLAQVGLTTAAEIVRTSAKAIEDRINPDVMAALSNPFRANTKSRIAELYRQGKLSKADLDYIAEIDPEAAAFAVRFVRRRRARH